jgi:riboflavin kinase/FMN adenylyltransferase
MMNIGIRPTVGGNHVTLEVHIFDFDKQIYGDVLQVDLIGRIRPEKTFPDIQALKQQLKTDRLAALNILRN